MNVVPTVKEIHSAVGDRFNYEIILVNDGSVDRTLDRMYDLAATDARLHVLNNSINLGLGASYKIGIEATKMNYVMLIPGDNGFPANSIHIILDHIGKADIIVPYVENFAVRSLERILISKLFTAALNSLFWLDVRYYNGTVLHKTSLLRTIEITTNGFAYQAEALTKLICRGASFIQCPVEIQERLSGSSSALTIRNLMEVLRTLLHLIRNVGLLGGLRLSSDDRKA